MKFLFYSPKIVARLVFNTFLLSLVSCTNNNVQKEGGQDQQKTKEQSAVIVQPKMVWIPGNTFEMGLLPTFAT